MTNWTTPAFGPVPGSEQAAINTSQKFGACIFLVLNAALEQNKKITLTVENVSTTVCKPLQRAALTREGTPYEAVSILTTSQTSVAAGKTVTYTRDCSEAENSIENLNWFQKHYGAQRVWSSAGFQVKNPPVCPST
ncbi:MAG: hypothetical protein LKI93_05095 [Bifidobacteriaceae bacterium]|nr:hypothetical protein [Bifidobacteriaceae bacterium]MCI1915361.1 hypothetical protein [Bifidobacteriaceae bacterium]